MRHEFYGTFKPGKKKSSNGLEVKKCFYNKGTRFFYMRKRSKSYRYFPLYVEENTKIIMFKLFHFDRERDPFRSLLPAN